MRALCRRHSNFHLLVAALDFGASPARLPGQSPGVFANWKLQINPEKTEPIFSKRIKILASRPNYKIHIDNNPMPWKNEVKYLDILLHYKLSWNSAVSDRISKTLKVVGALHRHACHKSPLNINIRLNIYKTCVRSVLTYGAQVSG